MALAEDLSQEVFIRAWRHWHSIDPSKPIWPWLNAIVRSVLLDEPRRKRQPVTTPLEDVSDEELALAMPATDPALILDFGEDVMALPPRDRKALILHHLLRLDRYDIAEEEGISVRGADTLLLRARNAFRAAVEARLAEELGRSDIPTESAAERGEGASR